MDIELREPVKLDLGTDLSKPELEWIATTLRGVLGVPASSGQSNDGNVAT